MKKIPFRLSIFLLKSYQNSIFCVYILFSIYEVVNTPKLPPKIQKNGVPCKKISLEIENPRPSPMPKIALSHKQNCNQFVKERNILFNICQCTTQTSPKSLILFLDVFEFFASKFKDD